MTNPTLYHYDANGFFAGTTQAEMSPMEPDKPLVPFQATLVPMPGHGPDEAAVFDGQAWSVVAAPRTLTPTASDPEPTTLEAIVQMHLDGTARSMGYRTIDSAVTYAEEPAVPRFQREGQSLRAWRSKVWESFIGIQTDFAAGTRSEPTREELVQELPAFELLPESAE